MAGENDGKDGGGNQAYPQEHECILQEYLTPNVTFSILLFNSDDLNCQLSHGRINMIKRMQVHGLPSKDPILHLKKF